MTCLLQGRVIKLRRTTGAWLVFQAFISFLEATVPIIGSALGHSVRAKRGIDVSDGIGCLLLDSEVIKKKQANLLLNGDRLIPIPDTVSYSASVVDANICKEKDSRGSDLPLDSLCVTFSSTWCGEPECGERVRLMTRAAGARPTAIGKWPWQAAIYDFEKKLITCGAALIHKRWVLTAAHCITQDGTAKPRSRDVFLIYLGKHYRNDSRDDEFVQKKKISHILVHEDFNLQNYNSNIALLELAEDATLTERVQLVCLPEHSDISDTSSKSGLLGSVAFWGSDDTDALPDELLEAELPIIPNKECRQDTIHFAGNSTVTRTLTTNLYCAGQDENTPISGT
ncbi:unnamed protein product, partial [Darwinula stevensoni]